MTAPSVYRFTDLDRATALRDDASALAIALQSARVVPVWGRKTLHACAPGIAPVTPGASGFASPSEPVWLGYVRGEPWFAIGIDADDEATALGRVGVAPDTARFLDFRALEVPLDDTDFGLLAYARALVWWNTNARFCTGCGAPTASVSAGHARVCTNPSDARRHFPRTDPAAIVLVRDGDRCLLGRQSTWVPGRYSALAGFVEAGESVEDAAIREVREESGIVIDDVTYVASQPWPFPRSLMLGYFARAVTTEIARGDELEDVRWFTRAEVAALDARSALSLPGIDTIARRLIGAWLAEGDPGG